MELYNVFFETSTQKGMIWQNEKNFDFLSLIFDSQNIQAASLNACLQVRCLWKLPADVARGTSAVKKQLLLTTKS